MEESKYTPEQIADWFLCNIDRDAGDSITHLKLQKLVYYAQAWSLALFDRALFEEDFEAWVHGPVLYSLYQRYSTFAWQALPEPAECPQLDEQTEDLLKDILEIYSPLPAKRIEALTHSELPWKEARGNLPPDARSSAKIKKETMKKHYAEILQRT
ncbi:MAG: Panacea domain-containing protein [Syntrophobacteraceae bacterium]